MKQLYCIVHIPSGRIFLNPNNNYSYLLFDYEKQGWQYIWNRIEKELQHNYAVCNFKRYKNKR